MIVPVPAGVVSVAVSAQMTGAVLSAADGPWMWAAVAAPDRPE